jgi:NADH:ubiquinone oxidoreductase subunit F (NADH-binding)
VVEHTPSRRPLAQVAGSPAATDGVAGRALQVRHWPHLAAPPMLRLERSVEGFAEYQARTPADRQGYPDLNDLIATAEAIDLRGRGGAGFPFATKLRAVADAAAAAGRVHVVANGDEGEPASAKDRYLLATRPHVVLDGLLLVARALHAERVVLYLSEPALVDVAVAALAQRNSSVDVEIFLAPGGYVSGEETAVVRALSGGPAKPTSKPPRPYQRGIDAQPTLVSNVETLAHLARAVRLGPVRIREDGLRSAPGTTLVTVTPDAGDAVLLEMPFGVPVREVLRYAGYPAPRALLMGGYFGGFLPRRLWTVPIGHALMREAGVTLGCASFLPVMRSCAVRVAADLLAYFDRENAYQCGACFNGTKAMAAALARLSAGQAQERDVPDLARWSISLVGRGACGTLDGAAAVVRTLVQESRSSVEWHARRTCPECADDPHDLTSTRFRLSGWDIFQECR